MLADIIMEFIYRKNTSKMKTSEKKTCCAYISEIC